MVVFSGFVRVKEEERLARGGSDFASEQCGETEIWVRRRMPDGLGASFSPELVVVEEDGGGIFL